jgi:hypothetical protein
VIFVYGKEAPFLFNFELLFELPLHILVWTSVGLVSGFEDIRWFLVLGLFFYLTLGRDLNLLIFEFFDTKILSIITYLLFNKPVSKQVLGTRQGVKYQSGSRY